MLKFKCVYLKCDFWSGWFVTCFIIWDEQISQFDSEATQRGTVGRKYRQTDRQTDRKKEIPKNSERQISRKTKRQNGEMTEGQKDNYRQIER